jgi:hypothetical protein
VFNRSVRIFVFGELRVTPSTSQQRVIYWSRIFARAILVVTFSAYSAAKFAGAQFVTSGGMLDKPVADLSGIELTWVYFGHSPLYANFVALGQLAAAALLVFNRTARLGAAVLLPITANIVAVNFGFRVGVDTEIASSILLALNLYVLAWELPAWKRFLWDETADDPMRPAFLGHRAVGVVKGAVFVSALVALCWLFSSLQKQADRPSPLSGEWLVKSTTLNGRPTTDAALGAGWRWVCFDPDGRLSVRANRLTFLGRYTADAPGGGVTLRYDPEPLPPTYPGQPQSDRISPEDQRRLIGEQLADFRWPIELSGTYRRNTDSLVVTIRRGDEHIEWVLATYRRPKF